MSRAETLATASAPVHALTFTGDGTGLLAATGGDSAGRLVGLRTAGGARALWLPLPAVPSALASRGDGRSYVVAGAAVGDTAGVAVALSLAGDAEAATIPVCPGPPVGLALGPDGDRAYATCHDHHVVEIDLRLRRRVRTVALGMDRGSPPAAGCDPGPPTLGPGGALLFIPCRGSAVLLKLDRVTLRAMGTVDVGVAGIRELARGPSGTLVALATGPPPGLVPLDAAGRPRGRRIELPAGALRVAPSGHPATTYVSGEGPGGGWLARVDRDVGVTRVVPIPAGHAAIAVWPDPTPPVMWFAKSLGHKNNPGP